MERFHLGSLKDVIGRESDLGDTVDTNVEEHFLASPGGMDEARILFENAHWTQPKWVNSKLAL